MHACNRQCIYWPTFHNPIFRGLSDDGIVATAIPPKLADSDIKPMNPADDRVSWFDSYYWTKVSSGLIGGRSLGVAPQGSRYVVLSFPYSEHYANLGTTASHSLSPLLKRVVLKVWDTFRDFGVFAKGDLIVFAEERIRRLAEADYESEANLYAALRGDLLNEAERLMNADGWQWKDGDRKKGWTRRFVGTLPRFAAKPYLHTNDSGEIETDYHEPDRPPLAEAPAWAEAYPTLAEWSLSGHDEPTATALGVARSTVQYRKGKELARLDADHDLTTELKARVNFRDEPKPLDAYRDGYGFRYECFNAESAYRMGHHVELTKGVGR